MTSATRFKLYFSLLVLVVVFRFDFDDFGTMCGVSRFEILCTCDMVLILL